MGVRRDSILDGAKMALWTTATQERIDAGRGNKKISPRVIAKEQQICERAAADLVELVESMNGRTIESMQEAVGIRESSPYRFGWDMAMTALGGFAEYLGVSVPKFRIRFTGDELHWSGEVQPTRVHPYRNPKGPKDYTMHERGELEGKESHSFEDAPHTKSVAEVRQLLARRTKRCSRGCKGWDIFDNDRNGISIEVCDECNSMQPAALRLADEDVAQLPEAQKALREASAAELEQNPHGYRVPTIEELASAWYYIEGEYTLEEGNIDGEQWAEGLAFGRSIDGMRKSDPVAYRELVAQAKDFKAQLTDDQWAMLSARADRLRAEQGELPKFKQGAGRPPGVPNGRRR